MDEFFRVDDLLNFPNGEENNNHVYSSVTTASDHHHHHYSHHHNLFNASDHMDVDHKSHHENNSNNKAHRYNNNSSSFSSVTGASFGTHHHHLNYDFTDQLCVPNDDVAELEWLSNFVDDSFTDFHSNDLTGTLISQSNHTSSSSIPSAGRSKRSRQRTWKASTDLSSSTTTLSHPSIDRSRARLIKQEISSSSSISEFVDDSSSSTGVRRCSHCASEKTPQWRTGPMGPKTLCNACGVRYKSGRLVPEYRPAASPTFVLTQHSNSHRKVMELRRQKEVMVKQQQGQGAQVYRHSRDFEIC